MGEKKKKKTERLQETEMKARCRETQSAEETFAQRLKLYPTGGKTLIKDRKKKTKKNSLDDLFIFCSSKILFHMNVSVLKEKKVCLLYYLCLFG